MVAYWVDFDLPHAHQAIMGSRVANGLKALSDLAPNRQSSFRSYVFAGVSLSTDSKVLKMESRVDSVSSARWISMKASSA